MPTIIRSLADFLQALGDRWQEYLQQPDVDQFAEFVLALSILTEQCKEHNLPGLSRLCEELSQQALTLPFSPSDHPLGKADSDLLTQQVQAILSCGEASEFPATEERREMTVNVDAGSAGRSNPRSIWLIADASHPWVNGLTDQLSFFGFGVKRFNWQDTALEGQSPLVILFIPPHGDYLAEHVDVIQNVRGAHPLSQLFCVAVPELLKPMVTLLRAGADVTIPAKQETSTVLVNVLKLIETQDQEPYRVLVVEDSPTAIAAICRTLSQHGIDNHAISNPEQLLAAVWQYRPDLVLMDMHMPNYTGIEATRVLRQLPTCQSLPVVYLSSETDMGMQVAALRLGGDQFISKPFNPVLLTTIVKTRIERYREMQRSSLYDGLTGLLNHTASKVRLAQILPSLNPERDRLCVAMLDIDHFKSINDTYGHPVGDQVIRNLAWLLKGRLRASDIIGRYGGEEFLVVLRDVGLDEAWSVLDRIRADFANLPHVHAGGALNASFSAGIAAYPGFTDDKELIDAADNALLAAKRQGRNRIERG